MKIAFYKGTRAGVAGVYNKFVRNFDNGSYSHCELTFTDGISASASFMDKGVRFKHIAFDLVNWDIIEIPWADEAKARKWFEDNEGVPYDVKGNIRFVFGFVEHSAYNVFCSEALADALGIENGWRYSPNGLYEVILFINQQFERQLNELNVNFTEGEEDDSTGNGSPPDKPPVKPPLKK